MFWRRRRERELADAREEALRWYERLGGQIAILSGDTPAVKQALVDAGERYNAAGSQPDRADVKQYELARETGWRASPTSGRPGWRWTLIRDRNCRHSPRSGGSAGSLRRASSMSRVTGIALRRRRPSRRRITTRVAGFRAGRCRPAGTPSRGGDRHCRPGPGSSADWCSSTCSPADSMTGPDSNAATTRGTSRARIGAATATAAMVATAATAAATGAGRLRRRFGGNRRRFRRRGLRRRRLLTWRFPLDLGRGACIDHATRPRSFSVK